MGGSGSYRGGQRAGRKAGRGWAGLSYLGQGDDPLHAKHAVPQGLQLAVLGAVLQLHLLQDPRQLVNVSPQVLHLCATEGALPRFPPVLPAWPCMTLDTALDASCRPSSDVLWVCFQTIALQ